VSRWGRKPINYVLAGSVTLRCRYEHRIKLIPEVSGWIAGRAPTVALSEHGCF
jgi:hypothetical protein